MFTLYSFMTVFAVIYIIFAAFIVSQLMNIKNKNLTPTETKVEFRKILNDIFGNESKEKKIIDLEREVHSLVNKRDHMQRELNDLNVVHRQEKTEVEFLVKMKEEKMKLDNDKNAVKVEGELAQKELELQKEYFNKTENLQKEHLKKMGELTDAILCRLPDINMHINKGYKPEGTGK